MFYQEGDLVFALKKDDYESSQYEWCGGIDYPLEYAVVTKVESITKSYNRYYVKFVDGAEDCMDVSEMKFVASCRKISREAAAAPLESKID